MGRSLLIVGCVACEERRGEERDSMPYVPHARGKAVMVGIDRSIEPNGSR